MKNKVVKNIARSSGLPAENYEKIIFNIEKDLKARALEKAHSAGYPLVYFMKLALRAYVDGNLEIKMIFNRYL